MMAIMKYLNIAMMEYFRKMFSLCVLIPFGNTTLQISSCPPCFFSGPEEETRLLQDSPREGRQPMLTPLALLT